MRKKSAGNKNILVLGGEGFLGKNICQFLGNRYGCFSLDLKESIFPGRKGAFLPGNPYRKKIEGDYGAFVHLIDNPASEGVFLNEELQLIENAGIRSGKHLIIFSSAAIYANPDSEYAIRKKMFEEFYAEYCRERGIDLSICRLFNAFGEYQMPHRKGSLVANIFCNYLNRKPVEINDLNAKRDFLYAHDIARMVEYIIFNNLQGLFEIGSGKLISIKKLLETIEKKVLGEKLNVNDNQIAETEISPFAKNKLLEKIRLSSLEKGLRETFHFYKRNIKKINNSL